MRPHSAAGPSGERFPQARVCLGCARVGQDQPGRSACPPELAVRRYNTRPTHPVHVVTTLRVEAMAEYDRPVGIGALVTVDTTVTVDVNAVASAVRDCYDHAY